MQEIDGWVGQNWPLPEILLAEKLSDVQNKISKCHKVLSFCDELNYLFFNDIPVKKMSNDHSTQICFLTWIQFILFDLI